MTKPADAALEIRALPWRPRYRRPKVNADLSDASLLDVDDELGIGLVISIALLILFPVGIVVLAILLLPVEAVLAAVIGIGVLVARFTGVIPWTVTFTDENLEQISEKHRFLPGALRRIRDLNGRRGVRVRWSWTGPAATSSAG